MASLRVPKKHYGGMEKFLLLPESDFQHVFNALHDAPIVLDVRKLISEAFLGVENVADADALSITEAILSLTLAKATADTASSEYANDLMQAIRESELAYLLEQVGSESAKARLEALFGIASLSIGSKANSIMYEYENVYYRSRVLTDVRPVFGADSDSVDINAALIIHNLRVHYHIGGEHKDFFVALDTKDLQQLIDVLERAKVKAAKLKAMLAASETPCVESL